MITIIVTSTIIAISIPKCSITITVIMCIMCIIVIIIMRLICALLWWWLCVLCALVCLILYHSTYLWYVILLHCITWTYYSVRRRKCRYSIVVRSWAGVRRSRFQFQPSSSIRVRSQTLQSLWGSAFASGANTGQLGQELVWKSRRVNQKTKQRIICVHMYTYTHTYT